MTRPSYALAPLPQPRAAAPPYGTRAQLTLREGGVEGYLALVGNDPRVGTASYALRVVNDAAHPLRARMTCSTLRGESVLAYPLDVFVAPFSTCETMLPVRLKDVGPYDRAIVQIEGGEIAFSLEAPAPPRRSSRARWIAACAALAVAVGAGVAAGAATPRLALLDAPTRSFAGTTLDVPYAFGGFAAMEYALTTTDGRQLAAGMKFAHDGTMAFTVPSGAGSNLVLRVHLAGLLGSVDATRRVSLGKPAVRKTAPAAAAPRIANLAIVTPQVHAGDDMTVRYDTNADSGELWLIDDSGRLWAQTAIAADGTGTLHVPQSAAGLPMRVVLHARKDGMDATASVALTVLPGALQAQPAQNAAASAPALQLSADRVFAGGEVVAKLTGSYTDATVTLTDAGGNVISQGAISATQDAVTFSVPTSSTAATYYVTAQVDEGVSQQTVVRELTVTPR